MDGPPPSLSAQRPLMGGTSAGTSMPAVGCEASWGRAARDADRPRSDRDYERDRDRSYDRDRGRDRDYDRDRDRGASLCLDPDLAPSARWPPTRPVLRPLSQSSSARHPSARRPRL
eukprot:3819742-Prymnesium_polylepis.1